MYLQLVYQGPIASFVTTTTIIIITTTAAAIDFVINIIITVAFITTTTTIVVVIKRIFIGYFRHYLSFNVLEVGFLLSFNFPS